jgi:hypothetical protein
MMAAAMGEEAASTRAMMAAAMGEEAEVPVWEEVQWLCTSVQYD